LELQLAQLEQLALMLVLEVFQQQLVVLQLLFLFLEFVFLLFCFGNLQMHLLTQGMTTR
jgi:hypothetical protein